MYQGNQYVSPLATANTSTFRMNLQRFLCSYRAFVVIFIIFLFTLFLYYYNESIAILRSREIDLNRCQQKLDSVSAQLQVVYEHKSRLEKALTGDKEACQKRIDDITKTMKTAKTDLEKSQTELKKVQTQQDTIQKQMATLKTEKDASEKAVSKAGLDALEVKNQYAKEIEGYKAESVKLNGIVLQLQTAFNKTWDQNVLLQQQLAYMQQHSQTVQAAVVAAGQHQPSFGVALKEAAQFPMLQQFIPTATQPSALAAPLANGSLPQQQQQPIGNAGVPPLAQQTVPAQPQAEQVAVPMAEQQQQQLLAQRQVPQQQQQASAAAVAGAGAPPVLQHPLGEAQQQLLMVRPNQPAAPAAPAPVPITPIVQAPPPIHGAGDMKPLVQQAAAPAVAAAAAPAPVAVAGGEGDGDIDQEAGGAGAGAGYHDAEQQPAEAIHRRHAEPNLKWPAGEDYKDDEEQENKQKDFDTER